MFVLSQSILGVACYGIVLKQYLTNALPKIEAGRPTLAKCHEKNLQVTACLLTSDWKPQELRLIIGASGYLYLNIHRCRKTQGFLKEQNTAAKYLVYLNMSGTASLISRDRGTTFFPDWFKVPGVLPRLLGGKGHFHPLVQFKALPLIFLSF